MKRYLFVPLLFALMILFSGCQSEKSPVAANDDSNTKTEVVMVDDIGTSSWAADPFNLSAATLEGDELNLNVAYSGGCQEHLFRFVAERNFIDGDPVEAVFVLSHNANDDACEAWITNKLNFNLSPLKAYFRSVYQVNEGQILIKITDTDKTYEVVYEF